MCMAGEEGLEPSHAGIKIRCLNQLGDSPMASTPMKQHCKTDAFLAPEPQNLSIFAGVAFSCKVWYVDPQTSVEESIQINNAKLKGWFKR